MTEKISGRVVRPGAVVPGYVEVDGPTILSVSEHGHTGDDIIVPGFVDLHCHGGGGHTFTQGDPVDARAAAEFHQAHGTTTMLASLVSSPYELMRDATAAYAPLVAAGVIAGVHFEGPYLSHARCGAQNPSFLRDPSLEELSALVELGAGAVRMVTIAPELPGALAAVEFLARRGVVAALGHTDATYEETLAGVAAGASVGTHLFNGMRPAHHREPGPIVALLDSPSIVCELVADGIHLHDGMLRFAAHAAGPDRAALITDAMDAAGMPDGEYELGGQAVAVADRVARLVRDGSIAGSTLTMDAAFRQAVGAGLDLATASAMASTTPARALGLSDQVGALEAGLRADLVVLNPDLTVKRVMRSGAWLSPPAASGGE
ncbi:N-acetylglucosamine-6-phosphate deacetylase [Actinoplanes friuliensis]|uniref:N-acetylglucosamine-6-phosphate deacetylase n=1 Tax=Actinoplanes friuliensis DSM 7358 TaxID=1246995 RepID=U5WEI9_9ACTN|nr:N-acetylglucosamine-6-phosphate deacetylase [Actinoplanes friuliensis]AGZ46460.1 putative N-acetylglucosamine-6-phosphate deacetylase [Actinoplanes friuliensis DSM 7358]